MCLRECVRTKKVCNRQVFEMEKKEARSFAEWRSIDLLDLFDIRQ